MKFIIGVLIVIVGSVLFLEFVLDRGEGGQNTALLQIDNIERALNSFRETVGRYPTEEEGLAVLVTNPGVEGWKGPYLSTGEVPTDPWGQPYKYEIRGLTEINIVSAGPDATFGTEDDISLRESQTEETL